MGEFIDPISSGSFGLLSSVIGAAAIGIYALWDDDSQNNDDDDSTPGGGLMQPVACSGSPGLDRFSLLVTTTITSGGFFVDIRGWEEP